ncbi:MAG: 1-acyl-sn-glycerol-3-phosphate acyltransferase [bacterium]|nr:1-acyl-sn-glycerol-3-phosphate acyltransferase [bacterium]
MRPERERHRAVRLARTVALVAHLVVVWLAAVTLVPRLGADTRAVWLARFARQTLGILGVRLVRRGARGPVDGPVLVVANHVSWLDVYALQAWRGGRSVAKREVCDWPVAGAIVRGFGTFFIVRGCCRDAARVKDTVAAALRAGERVVVFPEGTTTDGAAVGRFYAALLQAAVDAGVPVQPVALRYLASDGARDPAAAFVGDMSFVDSLRQVLGRRALAAELTWGPLLQPAGETRRTLAATSHRFIATALCDVPDLPRPIRLPQAA